MQIIFNFAKKKMFLLTKVASKREQNKFICYVEREQLHEGEARIID